MRMFAAVLLIGVLACERKAERADTTTLQPVDTVEPAAPDTFPTPITSPVGSKTGSSKTQAASKTSTKTSGQRPDTARGDSIIGHDRAIPFDPKRPMLDTVKKRPPLE